MWKVSGRIDLLSKSQRACSLRTRPHKDSHHDHGVWFFITQKSREGGVRNGGRQTEQVKTGQVNLDHTLVGASVAPSWDVSWELSWGVLEGLKTRKINPRGSCCGCSPVANCAPNLRKIAGLSFRTSEEGCTKLSQICREFQSQFRAILCKYPLSNAPFSEFLDYMFLATVADGKTSASWGEGKKIA